jgi:hypothetical protein
VAAKGSLGSSALKRVARTLGSRAGVMAVVSLAWSPSWAEGAAAPHPNDILVIANRSVSASRVSREDLRRLFLRQRSVWSSGGRAIPINATDRASRERFRRHVLRMTRIAEQRYWQEQQVRGRPGPPAKLRRVLKAVFKVKGAVSYVRRSRCHAGIVKVLYVIPHQPKPK